MKFIVPNNVMTDAFRRVGKVVGTRSTLPVLSNVHIRASGNTVTLSATNLEAIVSVSYPSVIESEGEITLPFLTLNAIVGGRPSTEETKYNLDEKKTAVRLTSGRFRAEIKGIDAMEFPTIPKAHDMKERSNSHITMTVGELLEHFDAVSFSAARDMTRPALAGINIAFDEGGLEMTTTDGFRLAFLEETIPGLSPMNNTFPASSVPALTSLLKGVDEDETITIFFTDNQAVIYGDGYQFICQLINNTYPDAKPIMQITPTAKITFNTGDMKQALKSAQVFAAESNNTIRLTIQGESNNELVITANSTEIGDSEEVVSCKTEIVTAEEVKAAFNVAYLLEAINHCGEDTVFEYANPANPGVFRPVHDETRRYIIMPMHIR